MWGGEVKREGAKVILKGRVRDACMGRGGGRPTLTVPQHPCGERLNETKM